MVGGRGKALVMASEGEGGRKEEEKEGAGSTEEGDGWWAERGGHVCVCVSECICVCSLDPIGSFPAITLGEMDVAPFAQEENHLL